MNPIDTELHEALCGAQLERAEELLCAGANINSYTEFGESLLDDIILRINDEIHRCAVVRFMLEHGADPRLLTDEGGGPLFSGVIQQDTEVLQMLLDHGADPNREHDMGEPLYDWAEFHFRNDYFDLNLSEKPSASDETSADAWLQFLDRLAMKYGKRRPDFLFLLRERGALTYNEQQLKLKEKR
jgi:ankyrin repeat protein